MEGGPGRERSGGRGTGGTRRGRDRRRGALGPVSGTATLLASMAVGIALPCEASGQDDMAALAAIVGGAFQYDLSGTGTVPFGGVRLTLPLHRWILVEPALTYAAYDAQSGDEIPLLIPEAQVQGRWPLGRIDPFLGVGVGGVFDMRESRGGQELVVSTLSAAAGARGWLGRGWSARAELRVRGVDGFTGAVAEWTVGLGRAF